MRENVPVRFGRGRLDSLATKGLAAYLIASVDSTAPDPHIGAKESTNPRFPDPSRALGEQAD